MQLAELDRDRIARSDGSGLTADSHSAIAAQDVVDLRDFAMQVGPRRRGGREQQVVHMGPGSEEHRRVEGAAILGGSGAAVHLLDWTQQRAVEPHGHDDGDGTELYVAAGITASE